MIFSYRTFTYMLSNAARIMCAFTATDLSFRDNNKRFLDSSSNDRNDTDEGGLEIVRN